MLKNNNEMGKYLNDDGDVLVKESRFSYIRSSDGTTRLIVYNCSNVTDIEDIVHCESKTIVKVSDDCMLVFASDDLILE